MKNLLPEDMEFLFSKRNDDTKKDDGLKDQSFILAMNSVKPLKPSKKVPLENKHCINQSITFANKTKSERISHKFNVSMLCKKEIKQVQKNKIPIDGTLDLHGKTIKEAELLLEGFIENAYYQHKRMLIVITGKGRHSTENPQRIGILKNFFLQWIKEDFAKQYIISYSNAHPSQGGEGAFYIRIRKQ